MKWPFAMRWRLDVQRQITVQLCERTFDLEAALIDARDTFAGDENDDRYWAWFNRHEDKAFAGLSEKREGGGDAD